VLHCALYTRRQTDSAASYCTSQKTPCLNYENFLRPRCVSHREVSLNLYRSLDNSVSINHYRLLSINIIYCGLLSIKIAYFRLLWMNRDSYRRGCNSPIHSLKGIICRESSEIALRVLDKIRQSALMRDLTVYSLYIFAFSADRVVHHRKKAWLSTTTGVVCPTEWSRYRDL